MVDILHNLHVIENHNCYITVIPYHPLEADELTCNCKNKKILNKNNHI